MTRRFLVALLVSALAFPLAVEATGASNSDRHAGPRAGVDEDALWQDKLRRRFDDVRAMLLWVAQRLESTGKAKDRETAKRLHAILEKASEQGIDGKFLVLIAALNEGDRFTNLAKINDLVKKHAELAAELRTLIAMLLEGDRGKFDGVLRELVEELRRLEAAEWAERDRLLGIDK